MAGNLNLEQITTLFCHVGKTGDKCRVGSFQESDFAGDLEDSEWTSDGILYIFGSHVRSDHLDVQNTICNFTQFYGI